MTMFHRNKTARKKHFGMILAAALLMFAMSAISAAAAEVLSPAAQRGLVLVRTNCSQCHSVDKISDSPLKIAPPFRTLHTKYAIESLRRPLSEGVLTGHPTMPVFRLDPGQVEDIIAFFKTLE